MICPPTSHCGSLLFYFRRYVFLSLVLLSSAYVHLLFLSICHLTVAFSVPLSLSVCLSVCVPLRIVKASAKSLATAVASLSYQLTYCALLPSNETPVEQRRPQLIENQPNVSFCVIVFNCVDVSLTPVQIIDCAYTVCLSVCLCICVFGWVFLCAFHCFACFASTWSASKTE